MRTSAHLSTNLFQDLMRSASRVINCVEMGFTREIVRQAHIAGPTRLRPQTH